MSLLHVTIKPQRFAPNELSRMDDHFGLSKVTWLPRGPIGREVNDFSC